MKVEGPSKSDKTGKSGKARKSRGAEGGGFDKLVSGASGETTQASGVSQVNPAGAVDALLAVQEVADATSGASRGKARAEFLLQKLDEIRLGILNGAIPRKTLEDLTRTINMKRDKIDDERLVEILDEVDLRAQVELAKLERAEELQKKAAKSAAESSGESSGESGAEESAGDAGQGEGPQRA